MSEENKELEGKKMEDGQVGDAAGGFVGNDKYTIEEYNKWGVTWEHNILSYDRYFIYGVQITQDEAEKIVDKSIALNRQLTREDLILLNIKGF